MKKILFFFGLLILVIIAKTIGAALGTTMGEVKSEKTVIERFVNEFVINNSQYPTPYRLTGNVILMKKTLIRKDGVLFVVEHFKIEEKKENLAIFTNKGVRQKLKDSIKTSFCTSVAEKESLFKGYSTVGLAQRHTDANGELVFEFSIDKSIC